MLVNTVEQFNSALEHGPYAWPGGYPCYFVCADGKPLSFESAKTNADLVRSAFNDEWESEWRVIGFEVNWEDPELYCADSGKRIPSAYAER
jgi:hypothetical protein